LDVWKCIIADFSSIILLRESMAKCHVVVVVVGAQPSPTFSILTHHHHHQKSGVLSFFTIWVSCTIDEE
jgi:hypothetical protein